MAHTVHAPGGSKEPAYKVLMVAPTSFFGDYGGHIRILEETLALQALGHRVTIVTYYKGRDVPGLDIRRTAPLPWHAEYEVGSSRHKVAFDIYLALKTFTVGLRLRPDVIHGHMHEGALIGGALARLLRVPLVFDFQGSLTGEMVDHEFVDPGGYVYPWIYRLERFISRRLPAAVLTSSLRARQLLQDQFGVPAQMIHPLPDCVDLGRFDPAKFLARDKVALRRQLGIPDGRPVVAYLGLLANYQGTDHLIRAAARLKEQGEEIHFLIMGFPGVSYYTALAQQLDVADRVTLTGAINYDLAPLYLSLGDVAVSAKMSRSEGSGKVLNYMAMGQPVVVYDSPVHREYLGEWGVYVPPTDVDGLAGAILSLVREPGRRTYLGSRLRRRAAESYSWDQAAARVSNLYEQLVSRSAPGRQLVTRSPKSV
jgi:glycosyltransferase involved in cell wall biosynthesis